MNSGTQGEDPIIAPFLDGSLSKAESEAAVDKSDPSSAPPTAPHLFSSNALMRHIRILSSDENQGRDPGLKGEVLTIQYLRIRSGTWKWNQEILMVPTCRTLVGRDHAGTRSDSRHMRLQDL